jgi:broad specificity phosphatase PhoE
MNGGIEVLLLRHAESAANQERRFGGHGPWPLTELGRSQAEATARVLAAEQPISRLVSSDTVRALETSAPIERATGVRVAATAALRERSVGVLTGLTIEEARERHPDAYHALMRRDPEARPPEGETFIECRARAVGALDEAIAASASGRVLMVSHALTIYLLLRHVLGLPDEPAAPRVFFQTDNCALHRLRLLPSGVWRVEALNDRAHLATLGR